MYSVQSTNQTLGMMTPSDPALSLCGVISYLVFSQSAWAFTVDRRTISNKLIQQKRKKRKKETNRFSARLFLQSDQLQA